jgi:hypothetical protein
MDNKPTDPLHIKQVSYGMDETNQFLRLEIQSYSAQSFFFQTAHRDYRLSRFKPYYRICLRDNATLTKKLQPKKAQQVCEDADWFVDVRYDERAGSLIGNDNICDSTTCKVYFNLIVMFFFFHCFVINFFFFFLGHKKEIFD